MVKTTLEFVIHYDVSVTEVDAGTRMAGPPNTRPVWWTALPRSLRYLRSCNQLSYAIFERTNRAPSTEINILAREPAGEESLKVECAVFGCTTFPTPRRIRFAAQGRTSQRSLWRWSSCAR
eukprot:1276551-Pyramimonas_sp.AAC.2